MYNCCYFLTQYHFILNLTLLEWSSIGYCRFKKMSNSVTPYCEQVKEDNLPYSVGRISVHGVFRSVYNTSVNGKWTREIHFYFSFVAFRCVLQRIVFKLGDLLNEMQNVLLRQVSVQIQTIQSLSWQRWRYPLGAPNLERWWCTVLSFARCLDPGLPVCRSSLVTHFMSH